MNISKNNGKLSSLSILIVDDDDYGRKILKEYLSSFVKKVFESSSAADAITKIKKIAPDIIITDIMMPQIDGIQFAQTIKKITPQIPIIFITASKEREILLRVIDAKPDSFLTKPLDTDLLLKALVDIAAATPTKESDNSMKLKCGASIDFKKGIALFEDKTAKLTSREIKFLKLLKNAKGSIISYDLIRSTVWGPTKKVSEGALKNLVYRVRQKTMKKCIVTVSKIGVKEGG